MSSCDLLNEMKISAESGHVAYTNFVRVYSKTKPNMVYCFFEGDEDKKYYYAALEKYDKEDDIKSMIVFFKYEMEKTWQKTLEKN